jgi:hypothetical protein
MAGRKTALHRRDDARAALDAIVNELAERDTTRNAMLIDGAPIADIGAIDDVIAGLRHSEQTERDRLKLLDVEVEKEKQANVAKQQASYIARFTKLQAERVTVAKRVQQDIATLWKDVRELVELSENARTGYAVHSQSARAGADSVDGAAMSAAAIMVMLQHEQFRQTWTPFRGGRPGEKTSFALPGAKPILGLELAPERVMPISDRIQAAADYAIATLKKEIRPPDNSARLTSVPASINGEPRPRSDAEARLAALLAQQAAAAEDITPAGEDRYKKILSEIVATTAEIQAWQTSEVRK